MAEAPLLSSPGENHVGGESVPTSTPRSFSYRLDAGNDLLLGSRRSSASSLFGSRRQSTESLPGSRRGSGFGSKEGVLTKFEDECGCRGVGPVYGSRYGFGNTFVQVDDTGIYFSSLAVTIALSALATLGILLFTVAVTLSILLGQCQDKPIVLEKPNQCASFALGAEVDNLRNWTLPQDCITNAELYVNSGQYDLDFALATDAARTFLRSALVEDSDGRDMVVLDLDDTMLSSLPLLREHDFGADLFKQEVWDRYVKRATMPPLKPMVSLYKDLKALNWSIAVISDRVEGERNVTIKNLNNAGYEDYILVLRSEPGTVVEFKTKVRLELENKGFRIWASIGDQWSDLQGQAIGKRAFKLPNSLYYT